MSEPRELRDVLAEMMRRERVGLMRPFWEDWKRFADSECEQVRRRADHLIRLLATEGVTLARIGDPAPTVPAPTSSDIYRYGLVGRQAERIVRKADGDLWQLVIVENGAKTVEFTFTMAKITDLGGLVLTDDPAVRTVPGLGRLIAAQNEIYRLNATGMQAP